MLERLICTPNGWSVSLDRTRKVFIFASPKKKMEIKASDLAIRHLISLMDQETLERQITEMEKSLFAHKPPTKPIVGKLTKPILGTQTQFSPTKLLRPSGPLKI